MKTITIIVLLLLFNDASAQITSSETKDTTEMECIDIVAKQQEVIATLEEDFKRTEHKRYNLWRICYVELTLLMFAGGYIFLF